MTAKSIFKEYDIRGTYPKEINEKNARKIGHAFVNLLNLKERDKIIIGKDKRPSSPKLSKSLTESLIECGIDVIDIGTVTTPMLYFAVNFLKTKGGMMITASHNPTSYNGIKPVKDRAEAISGIEIESALSKKAPIKKKKGIYEKFDIERNYNEAMYDGFKPSKNSKINASFDYDGDRLMIKDKKGNQLRGDIVGGIIGDFIAKKGDTIIYDLRCSHSIPWYFKNKGVIAIPCRVGHYNIKKAMKERQAIFGMELTGHFYFKKFRYIDAPIYALKTLCERVDKNKEKLSDLIGQFNKFFHSDIINLGVKDFNKTMEALKENYRNGAQNNLDGLSIEYSNWWLNIRPSKTENIFRLVVEASTEEMLNEKVEEIKKIVT